jgi:hypothetical protein
MNGVRHQQQKNSTRCLFHDSSRLPALLAVHYTFRYQNPLRVTKDLAGLLEADTVLALIGEVLGLDLFKSDPVHYNIIITIMQLYNRQLFCGVFRV